MGRGGHRRRVEDVFGRRTSSPGRTRGLSGRPPLRSLRRVRDRPDGSRGESARSTGRAGRDLERNAVAEPALVAVAQGRVPAPRARRDVVDGAALAASRGGQLARVTSCPALLPQITDSDPFGVVPPRDRGSARRAGGPCQRRAPGDKRLLLAGRPARGPAARGRSRPPRARQELLQADRGPCAGAREGP